MTFEHDYSKQADLNADTRYYYSFIIALLFLCIFDALVVLIREIISCKCCEILYHHKQDLWPYFDV